METFSTPYRPRYMSPPYHGHLCNGGGPSRPLRPGFWPIRYLIATLDYFIKWLEANVFKFFKKNILEIFGVPQSIVRDNGTQFLDWKFKNLMEELKIKQHFL